MQYSALNIAANPHPKGIYEKIIRSAAGIKVQYRGDSFTTIRAFRDRVGEKILGQFLVWTEIDRESDVLDTINLEPKNFHDANIEIPPNTGFNLKSFFFLFDETTHQLFFECENAQGKTLSPRVIAKSLERLLHRIKLADDHDIAVTAASTVGTVDEILSMDTIDFIEYQLTRPNPDHHDKKFRDAYERMGIRGIGREKKSLFKSRSAKTIDPSKEEIEDMNLAAASNGYVESHGKIDGHKKKIDTRERPKLISGSPREDEGEVAMLTRIGRDYFTSMI
jgi:hypothetical protein